MITPSASASASGSASTASAAAVPAGALPSTLGLGMSRSMLELRAFFRERDSMVFTFAFPVIMLFIFGSAFGSGEIAPGVTFTQYFAAGMIASGVVLSSFQSLAIGIAIERDDGTLKRLRGTPMPAAAYFLGKIGLVLISSVVQTVILLVVGTALFGLDLPDTVDLWTRFAWIFLLGSTAGTVLGIAYSSVPRSARSAGAVVSPVVIVLQFISGIFFVLDQLPATFDTLVDQAGHTLSETARLGLYRQAEQLAVSDGAMLSLYHYPFLALSKPWVSGPVGSDLLWSRALNNLSYAPGGNWAFLPSVWR